MPCAWRLDLKADENKICVVLIEQHFCLFVHLSDTSIFAVKGSWGKKETCVDTEQISRLSECYAEWCYQ